MGYEAHTRARNARRPHLLREPSPGHFGAERKDQPLAGLTIHLELGRIEIARVRGGPLDTEQRAQARPFSPRLGGPPPSPRAFRLRSGWLRQTARFVRRAFRGTARPSWRRAARRQSGRASPARTRAGCRSARSRPGASIVAPSWKAARSNAGATTGPDSSATARRYRRRAPCRSCSHRAGRL